MVFLVLDKKWTNVNVQFVVRELKLQLILDIIKHILELLGEKKILKKQNLIKQLLKMNLQLSKMKWHCGILSILQQKNRNIDQSEHYLIENLIIIINIH
jgi:hypothetical protein